MSASRVAGTPGRQATVTTSAGSLDCSPHTAVIIALSPEPSHQPPGQVFWDVEGESLLCSFLIYNTHYGKEDRPGLARAQFGKV